MAGHSKFKNIMHRKGAQDKKRASLFAKLAKELTVAARLGGGDPNGNPRLRAAIVSARANRLPKDNIERAVQKGVGGGEDTDYEEIRYEGYGPNGVAVIVDVLTDNKYRSASDVRAIFSKSGGNLGESGSVSFMFDLVGEVQYDADAADGEAMFEAALEAGAEDVASSGDGHEIVCAADTLHEVASSLEAAIGEPRSAKLIWKPKTLVPIDLESATGVLKLMDMLDDNDDVQNTYANFDIPEDVMEKLAADG